MKYQQLVKPNLDPMLYQDKELITDWMGWCLLYVQTAFKAPWAGSTAWEAWTSRLKFKHAGVPPKGVYVPLWFSGYHGMGHVLIVKLNSNGTGKAWTTPNDPKPTADTITFASLSNLVQQLQYGWSADTMYAGWSEDIGGVKVIEKEDEMLANKNHLTALFTAFLGRKPTAKEVAAYVGKVSYADLVHKLDNSSERIGLEKTVSLGRKAMMGNWEAQVYEYKKLNTKPVQLKPGIYEIK